MGTNPGLANMMAYWTMNESAGNRKDTHRYNVLTSNGAGWDTGRHSGAAQFNGVDESLSIDNNADLNMAGQVSFCGGVWVRPSSKTQDSRILGKWNGSTIKQWMLYQSASRFEFVVYGGGNYIVSASTYGDLSANTSTWYFVAFYFNAVTNEIGIGVQSQWWVPLQWDTAAGPTGDLAASTVRVYFGRDGSATLPRWYSGSIDECFIYKNRVLSANEFEWWWNDGIGNTYNATSTPPTNPGESAMSVLWPLDEITGTRYTANGAPWLNLTASNMGYGPGLRSRNAAWFNGVNSYLYTPDASGFLNSINGINIGFWMKPEDKDTFSSILSKWTDTDSEKEYAINITSGKINFYIRSSVLGQTAVIAESFGVLSNDEWYFITCQYDPATGYVRCGVNLVWDEVYHGIEQLNSPTEGVWWGRSYDGDYT